MKRRLIVAVPFIAVVCLSLAVGQAQTGHPNAKGVVCSDCHTCANPTVGDPCLTPCPRLRATPADIGQGPESVILNELEDEYEPVVFQHKLHAQMSAMGGECSDCHHFSAGGHITSCKECHPAVGHDDLRQPSLKGAYHRQCMSCHEEWSGETSCEACHEKKTLAGPAVAGGVTEMPSRFFPPMEQPEKKVWYSSYGGGTVVTLFHRHHTERYEIDCATCHHAEGCGSCHKRSASTQHVPHSEEALHAICNSCHAEMSCDQCHLKEEATEFSHDRTGWPLKHHRRLACRTCHGNPYHFTKPSPDCNHCHSSWSVANFDHARSGLTLSDAHREIDCESCHISRNFAANATCSECHDSDYTFPAKMPGTRAR